MIRDIEDKLDKIYITRDEFKKIQKYRHEQCPNSENEWNKNGKFDSKMFFPLNNFILDVEVDKYHRVRGLMELKNFSPVNFTFTTDEDFLKVERNENQGFHTEYNRFDDKNPENVIQKYIEMQIIMLTSIMIYIIDHAENRRREERLSLSQQRELRENYEYKDRELYFLKDIITYAKIHPTRSSIQYRCECWGVRGHLRHLKNGKVIFIEPFKKGRKRDVLEPKSKTYLLGGSNDG